MSFWHDLFHFQQRDDVVRGIDRIESHYEDRKTELEKIQKGVDPLKNLLLDMEEAFKKKGTQDSDEDGNPG